MIALGSIGVAATMVSGCQIRIEADRRIIVGDGAVVITLHIKVESAIMVGYCISWLETEP